MTGRKRHNVVDTLASILVVVAPAWGLLNHDGAPTNVTGAAFDRVHTFWATFGFNRLARPPMNRLTPSRRSDLTLSRF
jgi:hypothetical protein